MNVGDVVVGAALPGVIEPKGQGTRVPAIQGSEFAESAVLDVDWSIIELNPSNGKIPKNTFGEDRETWSCHVSMRMRMYSRHVQSHRTCFLAAFIFHSP